MPLTLNGTTGEIFPSWTTAGRPSTPTAGQTGYNTTLAILETYNGSAWCPFVTTATTFAGNGPAFSVYRSTSQTGIASGTWTKVQLNSEYFDTANCFDSSTNYRFTPNVAGYYQFSSALYVTGTGATSIGSAIYKNGSLYCYNSWFSVGSTSAVSAGSNILYMNGTTDYVELYGIATLPSGTATFGLDATLCQFSGALVRSA